ncbi:MAG TPA: DUF3667 domain-containing protein [Sediminibacterium sp.]|nr:DUF3667 domain-containing protein [Sediminibacterium sp.]
MSHLKERKETNCLNCGAEVQGRYCHVCGQENIEPKESFWHLVTHFVYDVTHFDGKFFSTLQYLLFRPGFLSHEYLRGRRASYLHPIRMYVFTSAFFFLVFFSMNKEEEVVHVTETKTTAAAVIKKLQKKKQSLESSLKDSLPILASVQIQHQLRIIDSSLLVLQKDTSRAEAVLKSIDGETVFNLYQGSKDYKTLAAYDSAQAKLPADQKDGYVVRKLTRQNLHLREKYQGDGKAVMNAVLEKFRHLFPQMLFLSLPLIALLLQLLYVRKQQYYYVNHVIFTIHLYCGTFIIILIGMLLSYLVNLAGWEVQDWISFIAMLWGFYFWYKSMRNFYEQSRGKTILKYFLLLISALFIWIILFTGFFIFSAMAV